MKRVSFALILVLLSFGLSYGLTLDRAFTGAGIYGGGADTINVNAPFDIEITANYVTADTGVLGWSTPFWFYGTDSVKTLTAVGTLAADPDFALVWNMGFFTQPESWDGDLTNSETGGVIGDQLNQSGINSPFPWNPVTNPNLPPSGSAVILTFSFAGIVGDEFTEGTFCIDSGDFINATFDWLMQPPVSFAGLCLPVYKRGDAPPDFDNCPTTTQVGQWNGAFSYDLDATDPDPVTPGGPVFAMESGPGDVDPVTGVWSWQPTCSDVGSHAVVVCVGDAANVCPAGNMCQFSVQVNNTDPVIGGACGDSIIVGTNSTKTAQFTATDVNGGLLVWSVAGVDVAPDPGAVYSVDQTGLFSFTPTSADDGIDYTFTIRVTDCAGAYDECDVTFEVISELPFVIVIEKVEGQLQGHHGYVKVTKEEGSEQMWGFDFLIGYDNSALTFLSAVAGAGIADWEYFTYRYNWNGNCGNGCPSGLLRVIAIADENDGPNHPPAGAVDVSDGATLFTLDFLVSGDYNLQGQFVPIYFYWMDCGDNTIAMHYNAALDPLEIKTAMASEVYWYDGQFPGPPLYGGYLLVNPPAGLETFPTPYGEHAVELLCLCGPQPADPDKCPVQFIRFFGGGIDIIPVTLIDDRGDVNLNGVMNEIADAVVFTNYFIYGPTAFTINFEGQKAATEINGDGIALTVADLVYLVRIIVGDALALPPMKPAPTALNVTSGEVTISAPIGAAHLVFAGDVDVVMADGANGMELITNFRDGQTHAMLYSFEKDVIANGHILSSNGELISVEAATYEGASYKVNIRPSTFAVNNYPNPFNPVATVEMSLPVASDWTITVFNVVGQRVADFNGHSDAGVVKVQWDASDEASGIYFYKVDAGQYSVTKKMVLLK